MALDSKSIKHVIFDLDDTLFDTYGQLVQPAARESCQAMINAGLQGSVEICLAARKRIFQREPRQNIYLNIAKHFGTGTADAEQVARIGFDAFHKREIKEEISLFKESADVLDALRKKFSLTLVTMGGVETQNKKIKLLDLEKHFDHIFIVDVEKEKFKGLAFKKILDQSNDTPNSFVSIGNRIDSEIKDAKELGMQTILMRHGEYLHLIPLSPLEVPDAEINNLSELKGILA